MIAEPQQQRALEALQYLLTRARLMASEADNPDLAELLDEMEILPSLMARNEDLTHQFRLTLDSVTQRWPACSYAAVIFDGQEKLE